MKKMYQSPMLAMQVFTNEVVTSSVEQYDNVANGLWGVWFNE